MKVFKRSLVVVLAVVMLVGLTSCGLFSGCARLTGNVSEDLVGRWVWTRSENFVYTFNDDGTGNRPKDGNTQSFKWRTENGNLNINVDGSDAGIETWAYTLQGNILTLVYTQDENEVTHSYYKEGTERPTTTTRETTTRATEATTRRNVGGLPFGTTAGTTEEADD